MCTLTGDGSYNGHYQNDRIKYEKLKLFLEMLKTSNMLDKNDISFSNSLM